MRLASLERRSQLDRNSTHEKIWPSAIMEDGLVVEGCLCDYIANLLK